eukprot:85173-Prymnesium_polylepis.1
MGVSPSFSVTRRVPIAHEAHSAPVAVHAAPSCCDSGELAPVLPPLPRVGSIFRVPAAHHRWTGVVGTRVGGRRRRGVLRGYAPNGYGFKVVGGTFF